MSKLKQQLLIFRKKEFGQCYNWEPFTWLQFQITLLHQITINNDYYHYNIWFGFCTTLSIPSVTGGHY